MAHTPSFFLTNEFFRLLIGFTLLFIRIIFRDLISTLRILFSYH
jgi:hypothetical protein